MPSTHPMLTPVNESGQAMAPVYIVEPVTLCGVPGFALHKMRGEWRVSHIETGALCGRGLTQLSAIANAERSARDYHLPVREAVARTRQKIAELRA